jgi:phosphoglycolate phosphatase
VLRAHRLEGCFDTIQTADDNPSKPHPSMLLRAARDVGVDADAMVMIGDTTYDMMMASAAKVAALGVSWGCHSMQELQGAGARMVIEGYEGLADLLAILVKDPECG